MPSSKRKPTPRQQHPQQQHHHQQAPHLQPHLPTSDYDTDTANFTDGAAATAAAIAMAAPPPPGRTNTEINLSVLRRYYPSIQTILSIAPFAVVYQYNAESGAWEKIGVEGTGFVCQLAVQQNAWPADGYSYEEETSYAVVILNRKSMENFFLPLDSVSAEDIEITEEYIIVPVVGEEGEEEEGAKVYGLWVFSEAVKLGAEEVSTRDVFAAKIVECAFSAATGEVEQEELQGEGYAVPAYNLDGEGAWQQPGGVQGWNQQQYQQPLPPQQRQEPQHPQQGMGQAVDLMALFNKGQTAQGYQSQPGTVRHHQVPQPSQFSATADTDFFRTTHTPGTGQAYVQSPPPSQQNALLDLFKRG